MNESNLDALALEYQSDYGSARSYFDTSDFVDEILVEGIGNVLRLGFSEKFFHFSVSNVCVLSNDIPDSILIT